MAVTTSGLGKNNDNLPSTEVYFYVRNTVPKSIATIFEKTERGLWLSFAHSQASLCHEIVEVIEVDEKCATETTQLCKLRR
jgi:hypothetical protein